MEGSKIPKKGFSLLRKPLWASKMFSRRQKPLPKQIIGKIDIEKEFREGNMIIPTDKRDIQNFEELKEKTLEIKKIKNTIIALHGK